MDITEEVELYQDEDFCPSCSQGLRERGLPPNVLVTLRHRTARKNLEVKVCPDCDKGAAQLGMR